MTNQNTFEQWCILELFGHQVIVGLVTEQTIGGNPFLRVDVPQVNGSQAFTRYFGQGAIYSMTPVSEETALMALQRVQPRPVSVYGLLPNPTQKYDEGSEEDHDDDL